MRLNRTRKFEKATNKASSFLDDVKRIHDGMKQAKCPVDIEYDGPYAEVLLPSGFISKLKGKQKQKLATVVWNVTDPTVPSWNMTIFSADGNKVATTANIDGVIDTLLDVYEDAGVSQSK